MHLRQERERRVDVVVQQRDSAGQQPLLGALQVVLLHVEIDARQRGPQQDDRRERHARHEGRHRGRPLRVVQAPHVRRRLDLDASGREPPRDGADQDERPSGPRPQHARQPQQQRRQRHRREPDAAGDRQPRPRTRRPQSQGRQERIAQKAGRRKDAPGDREDRHPLGQILQPRRLGRQRRGVDDLSVQRQQVQPVDGRVVRKLLGEEQNRRDQHPRRREGAEQAGRAVGLRHVAVLLGSVHERSPPQACGGLEKRRENVEVVGGRFELPTHGFSIHCSTN